MDIEEETALTEYKMSKNAVVVIAIGKSPEWEVCKRSVLVYCERYDLPLEVITCAKFGISNVVNLLEKNQIYELFEKYDRILRLDYDMLITPNCPNLFEIVPVDKIGGVFEDVGIARLDRINQMVIIQDCLGNLNWKSGYINAGVVVASKRHRAVFNITVDEINNIKKMENIVMPEQDYLNYMIKKLGFGVYELSYKFNHIKYFLPSRFDSYIIHYAGSYVYDADLRVERENEVNSGRRRGLTAVQMARDYEKLVRNCRLKGLDNKEAEEIYKDYRSMEVE